MLTRRANKLNEGRLQKKDSGYEEERKIGRSVLGSLSQNGNQNGKKNSKKKEIMKTNEKPKRRKSTTLLNENNNHTSGNRKHKKENNNNSNNNHNNGNNDNVDNYNENNNPSDNNENENKKENASRKRKSSRRSSIKNMNSMNSKNSKSKSGNKNKNNSDHGNTTRDNLEKDIFYANKKMKLSDGDISPDSLATLNTTTTRSMTMARIKKKKGEATHENSIQPKTRVAQSNHQDQKPDITIVEDHDLLHSIQVFYRSPAHADATICPKLEVSELDDVDFSYPEYCAEYVADIYEHLHDEQTKERVPVDFLNNQSEITPDMRAKLINWMSEIHLNFLFATETLYSAVLILDRYLTQVDVLKSKFQIVGLVSVLISAKFEEKNPPRLEQFMDYLEGVERKEVLKFERMMLTQLNFKLTRPYPIHFLRRCSKAAEADALTHTMAKYLLELTLLSTKLFKFLPSLIAASCCCLARMVLTKGPWTPALERYAKHSDLEMQSCVFQIFELLKMAKEKGQSIHHKYSTKRFQQISQLADKQVEGSYYTD